MATTGICNYTPLEEGYIRLVEILPGQLGTSTLRIRFLVRHLYSRPVYETLSYVWGTSGPTETIEAEGMHLRVTENLLFFLLELRKSNSRIPFWIDALSINQSDLEEKSKLIPLMPEIYKLATRTICWIPRSIHQSVSELLERLLILHDQIKQANSSSPLSSAWWHTTLSDTKRSTKALITDPDPYHSEIKISADCLDMMWVDPLLDNRSAWQELNEFLENGYFERYVKYPEFSEPILLVN